jgi:hypothetical protein
MNEARARALDFLRQRKAAYQLTFGSDPGATVINDLISFCRARTSCFHADARIHAALEGRREVYQRIDDHLRLSTEELADLYGAIAPNEGDRDND